MSVDEQEKKTHKKMETVSLEWRDELFLNDALIYFLKSFTWSKLLLSIQNQVAQQYSCSGPQVPVKKNDF